MSDDVADPTPIDELAATTGIVRGRSMLMGDWDAFDTAAHMTHDTLTRLSDGEA